MPVACTVVQEQAEQALHLYDTFEVHVSVVVQVLLVGQYKSVDGPVD